MVVVDYRMKAGHIDHDRDRSSMTVTFENGFGDSLVGRSGYRGAAWSHLAIPIKSFQNKRRRTSSKNVQQITHNTPPHIFHLRKLLIFWGRSVLDALFETK